MTVSGQGSVAHDAAQTPLHGVDVVLSDLDGVIYEGQQALPHAIASLERVQRRTRLGFITNNASRTSDAIADHLCDLGLPAFSDDIVTSPQAAVRVLRGLVPDAALLLVVGGQGLTSVLTGAGYRITDRAADGPDAVVQGFYPDVGWRQLAEAAFALAPQDGVPAPPWVATNLDRSLPVAGGLAPGNGALVSAVQAVVRRTPIVAGKPQPAIFNEAVTRFAAQSPLFIGDRLDTDIAGAHRAGITAALVLTGVSRVADLLDAAPDERPDFILGDLRDLHLPYRAATDLGDGVTAVADTLVRLQQGHLEVVHSGSREIDLVRAAAHAVWRAETSPSSGLDVSMSVLSAL